MSTGPTQSWRNWFWKSCPEFPASQTTSWKTEAFKLWCWRRLLRVPWWARRSNQSILKEINPECSLERLMLKLKFQYFGHSMWKSWLIGKDSDAGKDWRQEEKRTAEDEMVGWLHRLDEHKFEHTLGDSEGQRSLMCCSPWGCRVGHDWTGLNWTEIYKEVNCKSPGCI